MTAKPIKARGPGGLQERVSARSQKATAPVQSQHYAHTDRTGEDGRVFPRPQSYMTFLEVNAGVEE